MNQKKAGPPKNKSFWKVIEEEEKRHKQLLYDIVDINAGLHKEVLRLIEQVHLKNLELTSLQTHVANLQHEHQQLQLKNLELIKRQAHFDELQDDYVELAGQHEYHARISSNILNEVSRLVNQIEKCMSLDSQDKSMIAIYTCEFFTVCERLARPATPYVPLEQTKSEQKSQPIVASPVSHKRKQMEDSKEEKSTDAQPQEKKTKTADDTIKVEEDKSHPLSIHTHVRGRKPNFAPLVSRYEEFGFMYNHGEETSLKNIKQGFLSKRFPTGLYAVIEKPETESKESTADTDPFDVMRIKVLADGRMVGMKYSHCSRVEALTLDSKKEVAYRPAMVVYEDFTVQNINVLGYMKKLPSNQIERRQLHALITMYDTVKDTMDQIKKTTVAQVAAPVEPETVPQVQKILKGMAGTGKSTLLGNQEWMYAMEIGKGTGSG